MRLSKFLLAIAALSASSAAMAHGYIQSPPSRDYLCMQGINMNCGGTQYEPQSAGEGQDGFPQQGARDGELPSGGEIRWSELNEQTADRWHKVAMKPGQNNFTWYYKAAHPIKDIKYYMTKEGWNPNKVLTRDALDLTPFCVIPAMPRPETETITHQCDVPQRTGYHVIYAVWDVTDTDKTFHKAIDVDFGQGNPSEGGNTVESPWSKSVGTLVPAMDLLPGSEVRVRIFDTNGERTERELTLTIDTEEAGKKNNWSYAIASMINKTSDLRAGNRTNNGEIAPVYGTNTIFTEANSGLTSVVITPVPVVVQSDAGNVKIDGLEKTYVFEEGNLLPIDITLDLKNIKEMKGWLFDGNNAAAGNFIVSPPGDTLSIPVSLGNLIDVKQAPGKYTLVITARDKKGNTLQSTYEFELKKAGEASSTPDKYDYVYPDGIKKYKAGTIVLQPKNNKLYECKPWPYDGWCIIESVHYHPGVGLTWQDAWIEK